MALIQLKCVNCGDNMHIDDSRQQVFCSSCGAENIITQDIINNTVNYNTTQNYQTTVNQTVFKSGNDADDFVCNGNVFLSLREWRKATEAFENATKNAPGDFRGWLGLATACSENFAKVVTTSWGCKCEICKRHLKDSKVCAYCGRENLQLNETAMGYVEKAVQVAGTNKDTELDRVYALFVQKKREIELMDAQALSVK